MYFEILVEDSPSYMMLQKVRLTRAKYKADGTVFPRESSVPSCCLYAADSPSPVLVRSTGVIFRKLIVKIYLPDNLSVNNNGRLL